MGPLQLQIVPVGTIDLTLPGALGLTLLKDHVRRHPPTSPGEQAARHVVDAILFLEKHEMISYSIHELLHGLHSSPVGEPANSDRAFRFRIYLHIHPRGVSPDISPTALKNMQRFGSVLFSRLNSSKSCWDFQDLNNSCDALVADDNPAHTKHQSMSPVTKLSLVYQEVDSPQPVALLKPCPLPEIQATLDEVLERPAPVGFRTTLYGYQKRSLWKIMQRELCPQMFVDPELKEIVTIDGRRLWLRLRDFRVMDTPVHYSDIKGGIICEDMGTGKTCLCIALIASTKHHISTPPIDVDLHADLCRDETVHDLDVTHTETLVNLAAAAFLKTATPYRHLKEWMPPVVYKLLRSTSPYYLKYRENRSGRALRRLGSLKPLKVYLSSTTLVIVPDTLIVQWCFEILKHTQDRALKYTVIAEAEKPIPPATELLTFDIVIISNPRFGLEEQRGGLDFDGIPRACNCPYVGASRGSSCACGKKDVYVSPLLQVHWLRMIVDEGHSMADDKSNQVRLASKLAVDRRWICTGTPMPSVLSRAASRHMEKTDLKKLESLVTEYLQMEPYASNRDFFSRDISKRFLERDAEGCFLLKAMFNRIMIRNQAASIEADITLPPLHEVVCLVEFNAIQRITYNSLVALIGANAVLSEREDEDYLFHPRNAKSLRLAIRNIQQSCFWYAGSEQGELLRRIRDSYHLCVEELDKYTPEHRPNWSNDDVYLLKSCVAALKEALDSKVWEGISSVSELCYLLDHVPDFLQEFAVVPGHHLVRTKPLEPVSEHEVCLATGHTLEIIRHIIRVRQTAEAQGKDPSVDSEEACNRTLRKLSKCFEHVGVDDIADALILATSSQKLNYIIDQIKKHYRTDKIIIYCQHDMEIHYIHEALRLAKIRCLLFHRMKMGVWERAHNLTNFNTAEEIRVIVMDVKVGSYGIDLSSASRVYFLSPVWQSATERQAIKRAHRIGCTKPVWVETLVIRGSIEQELWRRKQELVGESSISKRIEDDGPMRSLLASCSFIYDLKMPDGSTNFRTKASISTTMTFTTARATTIPSCRQWRAWSAHLLTAATVATKTLIGWSGMGVLGAVPFLVREHADEQMTTTTIMIPSTTATIPLRTQRMASATLQPPGRLAWTETAGFPRISPAQGGLSGLPLTTTMPMPMPIHPHLARSALRSSPGSIQIRMGSPHMHAVSGERRPFTHQQRRFTSIHGRAQCLWV
ncbi:SNF2 family N-terminal domain-containing protein [Polychytrium aggregatum]|uniref:SNF2 family N-terminal domain-containing protein n=1 Tax=Polychytrium aggregatum TaxID=110093 RepID=UPI0022FE4E3B|nr:SNF2 family N-terminal domain-containing protein [Polychytrium aggregatum]KAI9207268.1 SNF2 family N-terminal domain-containing protein [Polychytrium aggregatum]